MNSGNINPLAGGMEELHQLPASQVEVNGGTMTLTLTNASQEGVISVVGGPALSSLTVTQTTTFVSSVNSTNLARIGSLTGLISAAVVIVIVAVGVALYRRRSPKIRP